MNTNLSTNVLSLSEKHNKDTFKELKESFSSDLYVSKFNQNVSDLVFNYKIMKRAKRKMIKDTYSYNILHITKLKETVKNLTSKFWLEYFDDNNLFILMTTKRSKEWKTQIEDKIDLPDFNEENVRLVTNDILDSSHIFFAERIDSVLGELSKNHLTNSQFGFGEKIIMENCHSGSTTKDKYPSFDHEKIEALDELRKIVGFIKNKDLRKMHVKQSLNSSKVFPVLMRRLVDERKTEHYLDNGAVHIRIFLKGTLHISIDPEVAEIMNSYVANLYPNQIPSCIKKKKYFTKPKNQIFLTGEDLSLSVINQLYNLTKHKLSNILEKRNFKEPVNPDDLENCKYSKEKILTSNCYYFSKGDCDSLLKNGRYEQFERAVKHIGGSLFQINNLKCVLFEYDNLELVIDELCINGVIDDKKTYQQYYTKNKLSKVAFKLLTEGLTNTEIEDKTKLEPSCGSGNLLRLLPINNTLAMDISKTNTAICKAFGYKTENHDFIEYATKSNEKFDLCLMNPPFTLNQAYNHTMAAYTLLREKGRLVSILPSSLRNKFDHLKEEGAEISITNDFFSEFDNTNVTVFMLRIEKL